MIDDSLIIGRWFTGFCLPFEFEFWLSKSECKFLGATAADVMISPNIASGMDDLPLLSSPPPSPDRQTTPPPPTVFKPHTMPSSTDTHTLDDAHASSSVLPSTTDIDLCLFDPPLTAADVENTSVAEGAGAQHGYGQD